MSRTMKCLGLFRMMILLFCFTSYYERELAGLRKLSCGKSVKRSWLIEEGISQSLPVPTP